MTGEAELTAVAVSEEVREWLPVATYADLLLMIPTATRYVELLGYYAKGDGGGGSFYYDTTSTATHNAGTVILPTGHSGAGRWLAIIDGLVSAARFGFIEGQTAAVQATRLQAFFDYIGSFIDGKSSIIPEGNYSVSSQCTLTAPAQGRVLVLAYGAEISTSGAISGVAITGGSTTGGASIFGLKINHRSNADATAGVDIYQAWNATLRDVTVEANGVSASYGAFRIRNGTASDAATGSFWTTLENIWVRKRGGADVGAITYGVIVQGAANATTIRGGGLNNCTTGVYHTVESGQTYLANALLIDGVAFEGYTTAYLMAGATTSNYAGFRAVNNRFENGTTVFSLTGTTTQPSQAPIFANNCLVSNAGTHLNNPNALYATVLDFAITPLVVPSFKADLTVTGTSGSAHPMTVVPAGAARGIRVQNSSNSASAVLLSWTGTGNEGEIRGNTTSTLSYKTAKGLSATATAANNLRGSATFATAATVSVTFSTAEPDTTYFVSISGNANETFWVTSKATGGFTLNSSNATSTAVVDWHLIR